MATTNEKIKYLQIKFEQSGLENNKFLIWLIENWDNIDFSQTITTIQTEQERLKSAEIIELEKRLIELKG